MNIKKIIASSAVAVALLGTTGIASTTVDAATAVATVQYVPGYGINLWSFNETTYGWDYAGQKLAHGSRWIANKVAYKDGAAWYLLGNNEWMEGAYLKISGSVPTKNFSWGVSGDPAAVGSAITIKYVPGYGIPTWNSYKSDRERNEGKFLNHDTRWKVIRIATDDKGYVWYDLGNDDWVFSGDTDYPSKGNKLNETDKLAQARKDAVAKINDLDNLSDAEKKTYIDQVNDTKNTDTQAKINEIVSNASKADAAKATLQKAIDDAVAKLKKITDLDSETIDEYIQMIKNSTTVSHINDLMDEIQEMLDALK